MLVKPVGFCANAPAGPYSVLFCEFLKARAYLNQMRYLFDGSITLVR